MKALNKFSHGTKFPSDSSRSATEEKEADACPGKIILE